MPILGTATFLVCQTDRCQSWQVGLAKVAESCAGREKAVLDCAFPNSVVGRFTMFSVQLCALRVEANVRK